MIETSDFLIIGGGIAGTGAAARLAPDAKVTVLEMEDALGRHATGRSAAIFIRNYGNATLRALNAASEPVLKNPEGISEESLLSPRGEMLIATEDELDAFKAYLDGADGMEVLTADEAVALFPLLRKETIAAAAIERDAQDIDVDRLLQGFARLARKAGARFVTEAPAQRILKSGGQWRVETPKGPSKRRSSSMQPGLGRIRSRVSQAFARSAWCLCAARRPSCRRRMVSMSRNGRSSPAHRSNGMPSRMPASSWFRLPMKTRWSRTMPGPMTWFWLKVCTGSSRP